MKVLSYGLVVVFIVFAVAVITRGPKAVPAPAVVAETERCFIWNTEAGDSATLRLSYGDAAHTQVQGTFAFLPAEKDKKTGPFTGTLITRDGGTLMKGLWQTSAEGVIAQEEFFVAITDSTAAPAFGEMKLDDASGTYIYAHPEALSYSPVLQETSCADPVVAAPAAY